MRIDSNHVTDIFNKPNSPISKPSNKPSFSQQVTKLLGLVTLLISRTTLANAHKSESLDLAQSCRNICTVEIIPPDKSYAELGPYAQHIDLEIQPECWDGYEKFNLPRFVSLMIPGLRAIEMSKAEALMSYDNPEACNRAWSVEIGGEHQKELDCQKKHNKIMERYAPIQQKYASNLEYRVAKFRKITKAVGASMVNAYCASRGFAYDEAARHVQDKMLQDPNFFNQDTQQIASFLQKINALIVQYEPDNKGQTPFSSAYRTTEMIIYNRNILMEYKNLFKPTKKQLAEFENELNLVKAQGPDVFIPFLRKHPKRLAIWQKLVVGFPIEKERVSIEMENLIAQLKWWNQQNVHPLILSSWFHVKFVQIHPFSDGNGRTARLMMHAIQAFKGLQPVIFNNETIYRQAVLDDYTNPGAFAKELQKQYAWNQRNLKYIK